jgi:hypothetical protein
MKLFKSVSDRILKLFLSEVSAGACVAEHGCCCGTNKVIGCYGACTTGSCRTGCTF